MSHKMTVLEHVEANQASLSIAVCGPTFHVSCIRLTAEGELDHEVELFVKDFTDNTKAIKVYVELEAQLKIADEYGYRAKTRLLTSTVQRYL